MSYFAQDSNEYVWTAAARCKYRELLQIVNMSGLIDTPDHLDVPYHAIMNPSISPVSKSYYVWCPTDEWAQFAQRAEIIHALWKFLGESRTTSTCACLENIPVETLGDFDFASGCLKRISRPSTHLKPSWSSSKSSDIWDEALTCFPEHIHFDERVFHIDLPT